MKTFDFETCLYSDKTGDITVYATGTISNYYPATMYNSHGDPGDPAEGGEITFDSIEAWDCEDNPIDFPDYLMEELEEAVWNSY